MKKYMHKFNHQFSTINSQATGFTLVELLAVMVVFIVIGGIIFTIMVTSFQTSNKTDILTQVRQNGTYAITQMTKTLRNASGLVSPYPCVTPVQTTSITILTSNLDQVVYDCTPPPSPTPETIASNGAALLNTSMVSVSSCSFTCLQQSASDLPLIQINFTLSQQSKSTFIEKKSSILFQTSVLLRNINR